MKKLLLALTLATGCPLAAAAQSVFDDRAAFTAATGPGQVATFDDVPALTTAPFASGGVSIEQRSSLGPPIVRDQSVGQPHSYWFPGAGSAPKFLDTAISFKATFPYDVRAAGFDFTCFFCSSGPGDRLTWELYAEGDSLVASGEVFYDFSGWTYSFTPFFGVASDVPFRSLVVTRPSLGNWFADDLRFSEATVPAPYTLAFNPEGVGHILIVPYFSAQSANVTALNIVNTDTVRGKVVKVRFRGASNSDDVYDFQVFLSPGDVWTASVSQAADGLARLTTTDKSCTLPSNVNGRFIVGRTYAGAPDRNAETREGYIEIVTMADIVQGAANTSKRALYNATKHSPAGVPTCGSVLTALTRENAADYMEVPTTGLMAKWLIVNTSKHLVYSGDAAAIEARGPQGEPASGRLVYWDQRPTALSSGEVTANTADPLFTGGHVAAARYDLPDLSTPYLPGSSVTPAQQALQLSDAIAARTVAAEFFNLASLGASTDWVVSFPTRRYHAAVRYTGGGTPAAVYGATNPYFNSSNTVMKGYQLCARLGPSALGFYDREERSPTTDDIVVSPGTPTERSLCGEVAVLGINGGIDAAGIAASATFGSLTRANAANGFTEGWGYFTTPGAEGLPMLANQFTRYFSFTTNVVYGTNFPARVIEKGIMAP